MKTLNISDEQHEILKSYCFHNKMTIKDAFTTALNLLVLNNTNVKVLNSDSVKVVKGTSSKVVNNTDELDFTDREAQQLIDPSLLEKFGI
jgi:hypothetical protein